MSKAKFFDNVQDLQQLMEWHVKREVKHYRTDFYNYDIESLQTIEAGLPGYYWITRNCGTWFIKADHYDTLNAIFDTWEDCRPYLITKGRNNIYSFLPVKYEDAVKKTKQMQKEAAQG